MLVIGATGGLCILSAAEPLNDILPGHMQQNPHYVRFMPQNLPLVPTAWSWDQLRFLRMGATQTYGVYEASLYFQGYHLSASDEPVLAYYYAGA